MVLSPDLWKVYRQLLRDVSAMIVYGPVTRQGRAATLNVERLTELPPRVLEDGNVQGQNAT